MTKTPNFVLFVSFAVKIFLHLDAVLPLFLSADAPDFAAGIVGDEQGTIRRHGDADGPAVGFELRFIGDKTRSRCLPSVPPACRSRTG